MKTSHTAEIFFSIVNADKNYQRQNIDTCGINPEQAPAFKPGRGEWVDWQALTRLAIEYQLLPVFYMNLIKENSVKDIPEDFLSNLKNLYLINLRRNIELESQVYKILYGLNEAGIQAIPLKGPVLAHLLYNDLAFRHCSVDLDILIRQEALPAAEARLKELGYHPADKGNNGLSRLIDLKYARQTMFFKNTAGSNQLNLDLHLDICGFFRDSHIKEFWDNARYAYLCGHRILIPSYEDLFLYLCITAVTHYDFVRLKHIYDIHQLVSRFQDSWDWQGLIHKAKGLNLGPCLYFTLRLSKDLFNTRLPQGVLRDLKPGLIKSNLLKIWINKENILEPARRLKISRSYAWNYLASEYLYSRNWPDFLRKVCRRIFAPIEDVAGLDYKSDLINAGFLYLKRGLKPFRNYF